MIQKDWSTWAPGKAEPSRAEIARYHRWKKYLADSKLDAQTSHERAAAFAEQGKEPPT